MIVDTSAIIAILRAEPERERCLWALERALHRIVSAGTLLEATVVADRMPSPTFALRFDQFLLDQGVTVEPVTENQVKIARLAYRRYGKGRDHPAKLNFGDCFAYALARDKNEPLLFVGDDFTHTDIRSALDPG